MQYTWVLLGVVVLGAGCAAKQDAPLAQNAVKQTQPPAQPVQQAQQADADHAPSQQVADLSFTPLPVYFDYDSATLRADTRAHLDQIAGHLKRNPQVTLVIEGHCDDRGTSEYNLALGDRRARVAADYLATLGIQRSRVKTVSFGLERPAVTGSGEQVWAKNRRDEFVVGAASLSQTE